MVSHIEVPEHQVVNKWTDTSIYRVFQLGIFFKQCDLFGSDSDLVLLLHFTHPRLRRVYDFS